MLIAGRKQRKPPVSPSSSSSDDSDDQPSLIRGAKKSSDRDSLFDEETSESGSSDFIVEDEGVAPAILPPQFSMEARQDLAHQFKKIFQFFVHIAVRPAKERHEYMLTQIRGNLCHLLISFQSDLHSRRRVFFCPITGDSSKNIWPKRFSSSIILMATRIQRASGNIS
jgi:hypothetical protein